MTHPSDTTQRFITSANATVAQAQLAAQDTVARLEAGTFTCDDWCQSLLKLFNMVAQGSAAQMQAALTHSCRGCSCGQSTSSCCGLKPANPIQVNADHQFFRRLSVVAPFTRVGESATIPDNVIKFQPEILPPVETEFDIRLTDARYLGASYTGTVRLTQITNTTGSGGWSDTVITIEL